MVLFVDSNVDRSQDRY